MKGPLLILALLAVVAGYAKEPVLGFLRSALPSTVEVAGGGLTGTGSEAVAGALFLIGLYLAFVFHLQRRSFADSLVANPVGRALHQWWFAGWGFDWIYGKAFVQPFVWLANVNKNDFVDAFYTGVAHLTDLCYRGLSSTQTGRVRWYVTGMAAGSVLFIAMVLYL